MDIGARAKKILHAVVSEYLATGEAVGSQTVTRRYGLEVSAATVRTVMGDLEEAGLLKHAHTSGGRFPPSAAFAITSTCCCACAA